MGQKDTLGSLLFGYTPTDGKWPSNVPPPVEDTIGQGNLPDDVGRLDMRVGKVLNVGDHVLSKKYLKSEVHIGEEKERIVVSRLGKLLTREDIVGKYVILLCNVRHSVKGIMSNAFIMYALSENETKAELLEPPPYAGLGDRIYVPGYPFDPFEDLPYIWPNKESKRVYAAVESDLRINDKGQAEYKGTAMRSFKKGFITVKTLRNCPIKK